MIKRSRRFFFQTIIYSLGYEPSDTLRRAPARPIHNNRLVSYPFVCVYCYHCSVDVVVTKSVQDRNAKAYHRNAQQWIYVNDFSFPWLFIFHTYIDSIRMKRTVGRCAPFKVSNIWLTVLKTTSVPQTRTNSNVSNNVWIPVTSNISGF